MADSPDNYAPHIHSGCRERVCRQARAALAHHLRAQKQLSPAGVASIVAGRLPAPLGRWLLQRLGRRGWLLPGAVIPFDILERADCPQEFRNEWRELVRLAVFGLPGQGISYRDKHRQDIYQQLCAQVMSSAVDEASLRVVAARVLNHPDVAEDPVLHSMLRSFLAQREAALRAHTTPAEEHARQEQRSKLERAFDRPAGGSFPTRESLLATFSRCQREFDGFLAQFEEVRAKQVLDRMRELRHRYPVHIPAIELQRCEEQYDQLLKRAGQYRRQIAELAQRGAAAAGNGDQKTAAWIVRRLQAIHDLLPNLLPTPQFEELNALITRGGRRHEMQETARELAQRQQEVAVKIKNLAGIIHRFHELAARLPPTDEAYRRAELNYRWAVEEIRSMNTDWLSGLVVQLESLLEDLEDPGGRMQSQLDRFIASVRTALNRLCVEIRAHQRARSAPPTDPQPSDGQGAAPPSAT